MVDVMNGSCLLFVVAQNRIKCHSDWQKDPQQSIIQNSDTVLVIKRQNSIIFQDGFSVKTENEVRAKRH